MYQNPPEGTGVTFVEIADVFATCLTLPYTIGFGTPQKRFDFRIDVDLRLSRMDRADDESGTSCRVDWKGEVFVVQPSSLRSSS